jgi:hypothetical protein
MCGIARVVSPAALPIHRTQPDDPAGAPENAKMNLRDAFESAKARKTRT